MILLMIIGIIIFCVYRSECVKPAILPWRAKQLCDNSEYFIVGTFVDYGNGGFYYIKEAEKVPIYLTGRSPAYELAPPISGENANNKYLIRGYIDWELSKIAEKEVLVVEEWEILAPIHRSYDTEDPNKRMFFSLFYLDKYDKDTGAYYEIVDSIRALEWYEVSKLLEENSGHSYIVTSEYIEDILQWYIIQKKEFEGKGVKNEIKDALIPIEVKGCDISDHFGDKILANKQNEFLIIGDYFQSENAIYVKEWHIIAPIRWKSNYSHQFNYRSRCYFEQKDVDLGIYIP